MKSLLAVLGIATAIVVGFAALVPAASAQETARVRVVHASPDAPAVDVYLDGQRVLSGVEYKMASDYLPVPAGEHTVQVFAAGADPQTDSPVIDANVTLDAGIDYTVAAVGTLSEIKPLVLTDDNAAPAAGKAHVRVVHASPDAPAVDVAVQGGPVLFSDLAFGEAAGLAPVDAGTYDLEVRPAGTTDVALPLNGVQLQAGKIYTVMAVGLLNGSPGLEALTLVADPAQAAASDPVMLPAAGTGAAGSGDGQLWIIVGMLTSAGIALSAGSALAVSKRRSG